MRVSCEGWAAVLHWKDPELEPAIVPVAEWETREDPDGTTVLRPVVMVDGRHYTVENLRASHGVARVAVCPADALARSEILFG